MKKNNILIIVNTYFQLIVAISLKLNILKEENVDILLSDRSYNAKKIFYQLKRQNLFRNCYYADINFVSDKKKNYFTKMLRVIYPNMILKHVNIKQYEYDYLFFYNKDILTISILNKIYKVNKDIKVCRYEEGFGSYLEDTNLGTEKLFNVISTLTHKPTINKLTINYYCYNPDLMLLNKKFIFKELPKITREDSNFVNIANNIFEYNIESYNVYKRKYIFFEESFFCEGKDIDDLNLVLEIAKIVGKENLIVKLHPRNKIDRFKKYGIITNETVGIPWEIIQMNNDFSKNVFLTISSGSVLASRLYFNDKIKTYLLFNCTNKMSDMVTNNYFKYLDNVNKKFGLDNFVIPQNMEDFLIKLKGEINGER